MQILLISAGVSGRCCHLVDSFWKRFEGLFLELFLEFFTTGIDGGQLVQLVVFQEVWRDFLLLSLWDHVEWLEPTGLSDLSPCFA